MARRATWQRHADTAQRLRGAIYIIIFITLIYIKCSLSSPIWGGSYPYKRSGIIYPTVSLNKVRVGLKICLTYLAGDVARRRPSDLADG